MQQMYSPMVSQSPQSGQPQPQYMQPPPVPGPQPPTMARPTGPNAPRSRIDPNQIPSPVVVQEQDQELFDEKPYMTCSKSTIPLASTDFKAVDEGNFSNNSIFINLFILDQEETFDH